MSVLGDYLTDLNNFENQMGLIQTKEEDYFIEPMARTEKQPYLLYKRSSLLESMPRNSPSSEKCAISSTHQQGILSVNTSLFCLT